MSGLFLFLFIVSIFYFGLRASWQLPQHDDSTRFPGHAGTMSVVLMLLYLYALVQEMPLISIWQWIGAGLLLGGAMLALVLSGYVMIRPLMLGLSYTQSAAGSTVTDVIVREENALLDPRLGRFMAGRSRRPFLVLGLFSFVALLLCFVGELPGGSVARQQAATVFLVLSLAGFFVLTVVVSSPWGALVRYQNREDAEAFYLFVVMAFFLAFHVATPERADSLDSAAMMAFMLGVLCFLLCLISLFKYRQALRRGNSVIFYLLSIPFFLVMTGTNIHAHQQALKAEAAASEAAAAVAKAEADARARARAEAREKAQARAEAEAQQQALAQQNQQGVQAQQIQQAQVQQGQQHAQSQQVQQAQPPTATQPSLQGPNAQTLPVTASTATVAGDRAVAAQSQGAATAKDALRPAHGIAVAAALPADAASPGMSEVAAAETTGTPAARPDPVPRLDRVPARESSKQQWRPSETDRLTLMIEALDSSIRVDLLESVSSGETYLLALQVAPPYRLGSAEALEFVALRLRSVGQLIEKESKSKLILLESRVTAVETDRYGHDRTVDVLSLRLGEPHITRVNWKKIKVAQLLDLMQVEARAVGLDMVSAYCQQRDEANLMSGAFCRSALAPAARVASRGQPGRGTARGTETADPALAPTEARARDICRQVLKDPSSASRELKALCERLSVKAS